MSWLTKFISFLLICLLSFPTSNAFSNEKVIDSLQAHLPYMASDTQKVWMLRDIAYYLNSSYPDSAIIFAERGYRLARALNFTSGQIWNLYQKGLGYELSGNFEEAVKVYHRALDLAHESGDDLSRAKFYNILGVAHYFEGGFTEAIDYYSRGFALSDSVRYAEGKAHALNNLGVIYRKQRRFDRALDIYEKSLSLKKMERDTHGMIISYYNIGLSHSYLGDYEKSLQNLLMAQELSMSVGQMRWDENHIDVAIGIAHYNLGNLEWAEIHLTQAIEKLEVSANSEYISALVHLGAIEMENGLTTEGASRIEKAYDLALNLGHPVVLRDVLKERAQAAETIGHMDRAVESWKDYNDLNEELQSEAQNWAMEEMQARFELKDKEMTIALQQLDLERERAEKNLYLISGIFALLLFTVSLVFIIYSWKQRKQLEMEMALKEEALQNNELLFREMHHRTKNNLQLLSSLLSLRERNSKIPDVQQALQSSKDSVGAISLLHHRLYQKGDYRSVDFKPYLNDLTNYFIGAFGLKERNIDLKCKCDDLQLDTDTAIPLGLIINELVTNSIKHAFDERGEGEIGIDLKLTGNQTLKLIVRDNGNGMVDHSAENNGTGNNLLRIFSEKFGARLSYKPLPQGTAVEFEMPYKRELWKA